MQSRSATLDLKIVKKSLWCVYKKKKNCYMVPKRSRKHENLCLKNIYMNFTVWRSMNQSQSAGGHVLRHFSLFFMMLIFFWRSQQAWHGRVVFVLVAVVLFLCVLVEHELALRDLYYQWWTDSESSDTIIRKEQSILVTSFWSCQKQKRYSVKAALCVSTTTSVNVWKETRGKRRSVWVTHFLF